MNKNINTSFALEPAIDDLNLIIAHRIKSHLSQNVFNLEEWVSETFNGNLIKENIAGNIPELKNTNEWIILILSLIPHFKPDFFDSIIHDHLPQGGDFPEFGGVKGTNHRGLLPTGETAQFILAGNDIQRRIEVQRYFSQEHFFYEQGILTLEQLKEGEPAMSGRIIMSPEWVEYFLTDKFPGPSFSPDFPAKLMSTRMNWSDLVLQKYTFELLDDLKNWLEHQEKVYLDKILSPKIKPGYRTLFYGPAGTGKTLTALLLGKEFDRDVYRVDLSMVVSKYIGETEKNLNKVFEKALNKNWILLFDEADALFGKRTGVQSSHDKFANQEVSYLLQRVEDFPGLMILASNMKSNIDEAFIRRFNSIIHFPKPDMHERLRLWNKCIPDQLKLSGEIQLEQLAGKYELTGAMIVNIIHYAAIKTFALKETEISLQTILEGIRKEFQKEEKSMY